MTALAGQPQDVVDAVVQINNDARNRALAISLAVIGLFGFIGLGAALLLPRDAGAMASESGGPGTT